MKKILAFFSAFIFLLPLVSCKTVESRDREKIQIVATLFPYYDMAKALAGEWAEVTMLLAPGRESHSYEPTPQDILRITETDLFIYNGGEDEYWAEEVLKNKLYGASFAGMAYADVAEEEDIADVTSHEEESEDEVEYDEHIWTSPCNMMLLARKLTDVLKTLDSAHAAAFEENLGAYLAELELLDGAFSALAKTYEYPTLLFGDRFPFLYFCKEYGFRYRAAFLGCSTETEPSAATMLSLIENARKQDGGYVYYLENSSARVAEAVAEASGCETAMLCSCQSITQEDFTRGETYCSLMWRNYDTIRKGVER